MLIVRAGFIEERTEMRYSKDSDALAVGSRWHRYRLFSATAFGGSALMVLGLTSAMSTDSPRRPHAAHVLAAKAVASAPLEIAASSKGTLHWEANGKPLPPDGIVAIAPNQTINFRVLDGKHGVGFDEGSVAKKLFAVISGPFKDNPPQGKSGSWGTPPTFPSPQPFAVLQVSKDASAGTLVNFFCTQHGTQMVGALKVEASQLASPKPGQ